MTFIAWTLVVLLGRPVGATDVPVGNAGELITAISQAQPGDTLILRDGVWIDTDILFNAQGSADLPITLRAETPGGVIMSGASRLRFAGAHLVVQGLQFRDGQAGAGDVIQFHEVGSAVADHCRLTECAIVNYTPASETNDTKWVSLYGTSNRVDHCYFTGKKNPGVLLWVWVAGRTNSANDHRIDHNYFGPRSTGITANGEIIRIGNSDVSLNTSRTLVEANFFKRCNGSIEFVSNRSSENIYRGNTFVECAGTLSLRFGNRCVVEGNYFLGNGKTNTGGVRVLGEQHQVYNNYFADLMGSSGRSALTLMLGMEESPADGFFQVQRLVLAFNTLINCRNSLLIGLPTTVPGSLLPTTLPPVDCQIANNLFWATTGKLISQRTPPINLTFEGNIMSGTTLGISTNTGTNPVDPELVLGTNGVWQPALDSPARGAAVGDYPDIAEDIEGQARSTPKDIGCDQASTESVSRYRPTGALVGPAWLHELPSELNWPQPEDIVYGTPLNDAQLNATANVPGDFIYLPPAATVLDAGPDQALSLSFTRDDQPEAPILQTNVTINVRPAPLIIRADDKARGPSQLNPPLTASYQGFVNGDTAADLDVPVFLGTAAKENSALGSYPIVAYGAAGTNYAVTLQNGTLTITNPEPAFVLTVVANDTVTGLSLSAIAPMYHLLMIQVTTNLSDWINWKLITNQPAPFLFTDLDAATLSGRFYRAQALTIDLTNWKLTLPVNTDHPGNPDEILQPELAQFEHPDFFRRRNQDGVLAFIAPCGGVPTSTSGYPRSELREMTANGLDLAAWSTTNGTHSMEIVESITHLPDVKRHVVAAQIHDDSDDVLTVRLENQKLFFDENGHNGPVLTTQYHLGDVFTVRFTARNGGIDCFYNGSYIYTYHVNAAGCYFKAGCYTQSNVKKGDAPEAYAEVLLFGLSVTHQP